MDVTFRPIPTWERPTRSRVYARFDSTHAATMELLEREIAMLDGRDVVIGGGWREKDIRLDGQPRSNAPNPSEHPGVEVSFSVAKRGRLVFRTDRFDRWQDNLRAIALAMEALRKVERYGVADSGQQWAGFAQLAAGDTESSERGRLLVEQHSSVVAALRATHPDHGGNARDFADVTAYRRTEEER